ncbi:PAS domain S-box protein [Methanoregula sp.]|uniref:PAS domain S-box protein n=1 Tax=Methanoregula sp. TaxID=2052170 RepID=UPI002CAA7588|nr:PAS domain S-box protein [Methanoregula sp.]HVP97318.1 PAS domain S-box protein [Methanoregula sp.]
MISVLYVDDESALLEVTKNFMERGGEFRVDTATSAREAIEKLKAGRYDALVADYLMQDMDGLDLLRYLRPRCNGMPFILFTGKGGEEVAIEALNAGADFYLQKKGSPRTQFAELETKIRSAVARRQNDLTLRTSEENLRFLMEGVPEIVYSLNHEGLITYISPRISQFGYDPKDLMGRDFAVLISAEDIPGIGRQLAEVQQGKSVSFEFRIMDAGRQTHLMRAFCTPRTERGRFTGASGVLADVSESASAVEESRRQADLFRALMDLSFEGTLIINATTGTYLEFNDEACRQLGYTREEMSAQNLMAPEEGSISDKIREKIPEILRQGTTTFDIQYRTKDGRPREVRVKARVLVDDDATRTIGVILHDSTEEHGQMQILAGQVHDLDENFEQAPLAHAVLSPEGTLTRINRSGAELLDRPAQEITGQPLTGFFDESEQLRLSEKLRELKQAGRIHAAPFSLHSREGRKVMVSIDGNVLPDNDGKIRRLLITLTDITEQEKKTADLETVATAAGGILAGARVGIFVCSPDRQVTGWNPAMEDITGISTQEACGQDYTKVLPFLNLPGADALAARTLAGEIIATPDVRYEYPATGKCGWVRSIVSPLRDTSGKITGIICVVQEITPRIKALLKLKAEHRLYAIGAYINTAASTFRDLETLLDETCRIAVDGDIVAMAWIGLFDHTEGILRPVAQAGTGREVQKEGYPVSGTGGEHSLSVQALTSGLACISGDSGSDTPVQPENEGACSNGYPSSVAIPFRLKREVVGVITLYSGQPSIFSLEESDAVTIVGSALSSALDLLDKKTLQRQAGKGGHGSWERSRFLAEGIEAGAVPFAAVYEDGSTGAVNMALCSLLGYSEEELLSLRLDGLLGRSEKGAERFRQVIMTKTPDRFEERVRKKDGGQIYADIFLQAISDETSGQTCAGVFIIDSTERKQHLDALEKDRERYRAFFETMCAAVVIATPDGTILAASPAACRLLGQTEGVLCQTNSPWFARDGDPRFVELARRCEESGHAEGELRLVTGTGAGLDVHVEAARFLDQEHGAVLTLLLSPGFGSHQADAEAKEEWIAAFLDTLPEPARRHDAEGDRCIFNRAWGVFTGRTAEDLEGDGWMAGVHPDDRAQVRKSLQSAADHREPFVTEYRLMHHSGEYRWIRETCLPDSTGSRITCVCSDIHACRQAEVRYKEEKGLYRALLDMISDAAIIGVDTILDCNAAAARLFACTREDLIGQYLFVHVPSRQPDGRQSVDAARHYLDAAITGTPQVFPWTFTRDDGSEIETRVTLIPSVSLGEQRVLAIITDSTRQNAAERKILRLESYPEMNPNPVMEVGKDRTVRFANPASFSVLSDLGLSGDLTAFLPADFDSIVTVFARGPAPAVTRVVHLKERSFQETLCPSPEPNTVRIYAYDITDREQAADALAYANHKMGILTSITRHDIQNKLTGVMGYLDLLRVSLRDPLLTEYLDKAESSADAIRHHIEFTRDYESLGGTVPVWQEISPIMAEIRSHFDLSAITLEEPSPGFAVFADPMFAKVLYNLVDNSLRHGVHVRHIRISGSPFESAYMLTYEDDGMGIPEDKKALIFERGFTTSSGPEKSSGLGLFLARDILAITGITIKETGMPGKGSRFEMLIPPGKWRIGQKE